MGNQAYLKYAISIFSILFSKSNYVFLISKGYCILEIVRNVNIKGQYTVQSVTINNYNASRFKSNVKPGSRKSVDVLSNGNFFDR